jgi:Spy/CpxP family protein refolding chaperone
VAVAAVPARVVAALVLALALVSGVLLGIAADRLLLLHGGHHRGMPGSMMSGPSAPRMLFGPSDGARMPGRAEPNAEWVTNRLADQLGLSAEQRVRVDSIVTRRMAERRDLMAPIRERMRQLLDSTRADVEAVLTPEQRAKLDKLRARGDDRHGGGPPPSPAP